MIDSVECRVGNDGRCCWVDGSRGRAGQRARKSSKPRIWAFGGVLLRGETGKSKAIRTHGRRLRHGPKRADASILCHLIQLNAASAIPNTA